MTAVSVPPAPVLATDAWARLVNDHQADLWRYVCYLGAERNEADDLVQETFLALARAEFTEVSRGQTVSYLRTIARNQLVSLRRKQRREARLEDLELAEQVWAEQMDPGGVDPWLDALRTCVEGLQPRGRQAVELHYHQQASREAIAAALSMSPEGVKSLLRRLRTGLRRCIERQLPRE